MTEAPATTGELLRLARSGDVEAFGEIVERHEEYVYNVVYHLVGNDQEADDIAQEVFVRAFSHLDSFEGRAKFSTWLYGIALNCVRNLWRRRGRRSIVAPVAAPGEENSIPDPPSEQDGPEEALLRRERVDKVREAIAALAEDAREAIVLRDIQGLTYEEMAESMGVALGTVKSRIYRARQALKDQLEAYITKT